MSDDEHLYDVVADYSDACAEMQAEIDRLRARVSELEKALKPFANIDSDLLRKQHWDAARRAYNKSKTVGGMEE